MDLTFLPVYKPSEEEKNDPALFAENLRKLMVSDEICEFVLPDYKVLEVKVHNRVETHTSIVLCSSVLCICDLYSGLALPKYAICIILTYGRQSSTNLQNDSMQSFLRQGKELGVPLVEQSYNHLHALKKAKIITSWDGSRVIAPPGVVDDNGFADLTPYVKKVD